MKRITLVNLMQTRLPVKSGALIPPQGLLMVSSICKACGYKVDFLNFKIGKIADPEKFHLKLAQRILKKPSRIIGFTSQCDIYPSVINLARYCKKLDPKSLIILGGPHASLVPQSTLKAFPDIDIIVRGEAEYTLPELLTALHDGSSLHAIKGLCFRRGKRIVATPPREPIRNLNSLPLPDYKLLTRRFHNNLTTIIPGRGCPHNCTYCSAAVLSQNCYRLKSPSAIIAEIKILKELFKINYVSLLHDDFLAAPKRAAAIYTQIARYFPGMSWDCTGRLEDITPEIVESLIRHNCKCLYLGVETGSARMQKLVKKHLPLNTVIPKVKMMADKALPLKISFMLGFPQEHLSEMDATLTLALNLLQIHRLSRIQFHSVVLMPCTELYAKFHNKIKFTGRYSDIVEGPLAHLPENVRIIKKHPEIFSAFYNISTPAFPAGYPEALAAFYFILCHLMPLSLYWSLKILNYTPVQLFESFKRKCISRPVTLTPLKLRNLCRAHIKELCRKRHLEYHIIAALIKWETQEQKQARSSRKLMLPSMNIG